MTLMIDRLDLERRLKANDDDGLRELMRAREEVFEISNVAELGTHSSWTKDADGHAVVDLTKFPNVAPPYSGYWMEFRLPKVFALLRSRRVSRLGVWCAVTDLTTPEEWALGIAVFASEKRPVPIARALLGIDRHGGHVREVIPMTCLDYALQVIEPSESVPENMDLAEEIIDIGEQYQNMTSEQRLIHLRELQAEALARVHRCEENVKSLHARVLALATYPPLLMAHSLLGCRNVSTEDHFPSRKLSRARTRRGNEPLVTFKTLTIRPMGGRNDLSGGQRMDIGDGQTALHLVRGHFKTFTSERPLFGSRVGTYWWSPNVRGDTKAGVVVKDYALTQVHDPTTASDAVAVCDEA